MTTQAMDREMWGRSIEDQDGLTLEVWGFSENSLQIEKKPMFQIAAAVRDVLALFNVFCCSVAQEHRKGNVEKRSLCHYYLQLQHAVGQEVALMVNRDGSLKMHPNCLNPWLWRTSVGYFEHDDLDHARFMRSAAQDDVYETRFPILSGRSFYICDELNQ